MTDFTIRFLFRSVIISIGESILHVYAINDKIRVSDGLKYLQFRPYMINYPKPVADVIEVEF